MTRLSLQKILICVIFDFFCVSCHNPGEEAWQQAVPVAERFLHDISYQLVTVSKVGARGDTAIYDRLAIPEDAAFRKHPYGEWHYANGSSMMGLLYLADVSGREDFYTAIRQWRDWNVGSAAGFRSDFEKYYPLPTQNYRMFRKEMLDDTTAPCLPLVCLAMRGDSSPQADAIIEEMADYILHGQARLPDGCLCRPEPEWTVWCDDAFMGCSFLCRYADLNNDTTLLEECSNQLQLFWQHLRDPDTGLMWHGWHQGTDTLLGALWGRANGWYVWALSEVLERIEPGSVQWQKLSAIEQALMKSICRYQDKQSGLWHQVLDHPETYLETSCTAMFTAAMARAVRRGRLSSEYKDNARKGWAGLVSRIDTERGTVSGICRSMAIQDSLEEYASRETADNDPRGLGAFFWAASEISKL